MTPRAAIYARYSSDLQKPTSIEDQVAMGRRFCADKGWTVTEVFSDAVKTGKNARRPGLQALLAAVRDRRVDVIVIEAVDRFARRLSDALRNYELMNFSGVRLHSVSEGEQDFMKVMLLGFGAQLFSKSIATHTDRGRRGALENKKRLHSLAYGYRKRDGEEGLNRGIDPEEAAIVRRIFTETAAGKSSESIAAELNREGIPSPAGGLWRGSTLRGNTRRGEGILRNRLYIGIGEFGATHRRAHPETGAKLVTPTPEKRLEVEIPDLRIVPQELWDAAQAQLDRSAHKAAAAGNPRAAHRARFLLSGLLVCDCCGAPYVICGNNRYGCRNARQGVCENRSKIRRQRIEARVFNRLRQSLLTPELTERFTAAMRAERVRMQGSDVVDTLAGLRRRRLELERSRGNILRAIEDGAPYAQFKARSEQIEADLAALDRKAAEAEAAQAAAASPPPDPEAAYAEALRRLEELLGPPGFVDQAHDPLAALIREVRLRPDDIAEDGLGAEIRWDLGTLLLAAGQPEYLARHFVGDAQLTAGSGAEPRRYSAASGSSQFSRPMISPITRPSRSCRAAKLRLGRIVASSM